MKLENLAEDFFTSKKRSSPSSPPSPTRLPDITASSPKPKSDEENTEKESILAKKIAESFKDSLLYDEIDGKWYSPKNNLWTALSEKRALKMIMKSL
ncbi:MAG: hypothetical protein RLZZ419_190, partial [Pseudomonadota bacterium]